MLNGLNIIIKILSNFSKSRVLYFTISRDSTLGLLTCVVLRLDDTMNGTTNDPNLADVNDPLLPSKVG